MSRRERAGALSVEGKSVLFIVGSLGVGGAERVTSLIANEIADREYDVSILEINGHGSDYEVRPRIEVISFNPPKGKVAAAIYRLLNIHMVIRQAKPDIVISLGSGFWYIFLSRVWCHAELVLSERNYPKACCGPIQLWMRRRLFSHCDKAVFQTTEAMKCYPPKVQSKSTIIGNPITNVPYTDGLDSNRIVTVCRLVPQKNLDLLLRAFSLFLDAGHREYRLEIYGEGPLEKHLRDYAEGLGISSNVRFCGFCTDVHRRISGARMFVSSSDYEGMQNSLLESMAMGIPCIATDCMGGGARAITENGAIGLLVPRDDADGLASAMKMVAEDDECAQQLSNRGRSAARKYSERSICDEWLDYLGLQDGDGR